ncbi:phenylacetic acid degradation protein PaaN [Coralliovum pocilloporae]|uniref:phenylacetic acid degradation protein PaaN n=1 Tax=Coralliovum pocilloporae TaxID=3066369 RepID=UPI00330741FE
MSDFFAKHQTLLADAVAATDSRGYWSPYPEAPSGRIYGETARDDGAAAFEALKNALFDMGQPTNGDVVGGEHSPFGPELNISYPAEDAKVLIDTVKDAMISWGQASPEVRAGICCEILERLNRRSFEIANAVMHTTGQAFMMAFQAGGPHAQDRALEAVAYAYKEMTRIPDAVRWEKPQGKYDPIRIDKSWRIIPRGVALVVGCATFPTWNAYPGLFASLVTGNGVLVKPHPNARLPLAITVEIGREVLAEAGFDPNLLLLAVDTVEEPVTKLLACEECVKIIDFTGSSAFGQWLREHVEGSVYTEESGLNTIVISGTDNFKAMCQNIAFSLSLYSGQMCTTPQNIFIPDQGIETDLGHKSFDDVASGIGEAIDWLLGNPDRAMGVLGAIHNPDILDRIDEARALGDIIRDSGPVEGAGEARMATPILVAVDAVDEEAYMEERFGPIAFVIRAASIEDAIARSAESVELGGAITAGLYATDEAVIDQAIDAFAPTGVNLSVNLLGSYLVNQSAAFSDFHVSGANPAGNASLTDSAYVANRFRVAAVRRMIA